MSPGFHVTCGDPAVRAWIGEWLEATRLEPPGAIALTVRVASEVPPTRDERTPFRQPQLEIRSGPPAGGVRITWRGDQAQACIDERAARADLVITRSALTGRDALAQGFLVAVTVFLLRRVGWHHVHAASAVDPRGRGWLLAGDAQCGKSTTAALLAAHGWGVGADDLTFLDAATAPIEVVALRAPIALRNGGLALLARAGGHPLRDGRKRGFFAEELGGRWADRVRPAIIALPRVDGGKTRVEPVERRDALAELVRWSAWVALEPALAQSHLDALARLTAQATCVRLALGPDLAEPRDVLLALVP